MKTRNTPAPARTRQQGSFVSLAVASDLSGLTEDDVIALAQSGKVRVDVIRKEYYYSLEDCQAEAGRRGMNTCK